MPGNSGKTAPPKRKMPVGRPFQPGQSGNPSGRPKRSAELREKILDACESIVTRMQLTALSGRTSSHTVKAGEILLAYGLGKPKESAEISGPGGAPLIPSADEALTALMAVTKKRADKE